MLLFEHKAIRIQYKRYNDFYNFNLNQIQQFLMKKREKCLYITTFLTFSFVNYLNITYSFLKRFIRSQFNMNTRQIALADSLKFLGCAIGLLAYIFLKFNTNRRISLWYCLSISSNAIFMGMIPLIGLFDYKWKSFVFVFNFLCGLAKAPSWALLIQYVKNNVFLSNQQQASCNSIEFDEIDDRTTSKREQNKLFILWTTLTLVGNIFGLVIDQILIYRFNISWNICLIIPVICIMVSSLIFFILDLCVKQNNSIVNSEGQLENNLSHLSNVDHHLIQKCFQVLFCTNKCLFTWTLVVLLSIHSILMMFLPLFLYEIGYSQYQGYILAFYNLMVVIGSYSYTYINCRQYYYDMLSMPINQSDIIVIERKPSNDIQQLNHLNQNKSKCIPAYQEIVNIVFLSLLLITSIIIIWLPCPIDCDQYNISGDNYEISGNKNNLIWYFIFLGFFGFFMGGPLNKYESIQFVKVLKKYQNALRAPDSQNYYTRQTNKFQDQPCFKINCSSNNDKQANITQNIRTSHRAITFDKGSKQTNMSKRTSKVFMGAVQLISYITSIIFLIMAGKIIQQNMMQFFKLVGILVGITFILATINILQHILGNQNCHYRKYNQKNYNESEI